MNPEKLTQKSQDALREAQAIATRRNHQQIDVEHLLAALLAQEQGIVPALLERAGVAVPAVIERVERELARLPQVSDANAQVYMAPRLAKLLDQAQTEANNLKDDYVSVEHLRIDDDELPFLVHISLAEKVRDDIK